MISGGERDGGEVMKLFNKKFVYLEWDEVLEGKNVFVADALPQLRSRVERGGSDFLYSIENNDGAFPFIVSGGVCYAFAYYDPNYECKRAYTQGKTIQFRYWDDADDWADCTVDPRWLDICEYRVKPEESECNSCQYQCTSDVEQPCVTCVEYSNYKPRIDVRSEQLVKPKQRRRMTNHELARWLSEGNGEFKSRNSGCVHIELMYYEGSEQKPCAEFIVIRGWDETEWREPEVEE